MKLLDTLAFVAAIVFIAAIVAYGPLTHMRDKGHFPPAIERLFHG